MASIREGEMTSRELMARKSSEQAPVVLDVREPYEYAQGHIEGSRHIPMGSIPLRMHELPKDREIVVVCRSGSRSGVITHLLRGAGYEARNLVGGLLGWNGPLER